MNIPIYYDHQNVISSAVTPSTVHLKDNAMTRFFTRYLLQKAFSVFEWTMPETWGKDYFLYSLYCNGVVAVVNTDKFGVIPQACGLYGYDVFYRPTHATITNPLLTGMLRPRIGVECELVKLQPDYGGIMDMVGHYASMLALCTQSAQMNLLNSHLSYVFTADNKTAAEGFKKLFDRVAAGEPATVIDKNMLTNEGKPSWEAFSQNVGQNYITDRLLADMRKLEHEFDTEIGIPNANTDKKERLITDEVNSNNIETVSRSDMWLKMLQESCSKVNKMFNTNLNVKWRYNINEVVVDSAVNSLDSRIV